MKIRLTKTTHIPDETWTKTEAHPEQPHATNYAGSVLEVSDTLGARLVEEGSAEQLDAPGPTEVSSESAPAVIRSRRGE